MAMNDFVPMGWNGEVITTDKLNQMCNNDQYLFERSPRMRLAGPGWTRDTSLKIISGKTPFQSTSKDFERIQVYFGSFFSTGCAPTVTATVQTTGRERKVVSVHGLSGIGSDISTEGFEAHIWTVENDWGAVNFAIESGGYVHWIAVGY